MTDAFGVGRLKLVRRMRGVRVRPPTLVGRRARLFVARVRPLRDFLRRVFALALALAELATANGEQVKSLPDDLERDFNGAHERLVSDVGFEADERRELLLERHTPELFA